MASTGARPSRPSSTKSGRTRSAASSRVSRTRSRRTGVRRRRRRRVWGKGMPRGHGTRGPRRAGTRGCARRRRRPPCPRGARLDALDLVPPTRGGGVLGRVALRLVLVRDPGRSWASRGAGRSPSPRATRGEAGPLLDGHRVDVVVLPDARDPQVARGAALEAEARLLDDAGRPGVARDDRGLDAVQPGVLEGEGERQANGPGRVAAAAAGLVDPVAERRVLPRAAHDVGQRDAARRGGRRARRRGSRTRRRSRPPRPGRRGRARAPGPRA